VQIAKNILILALIVVVLFFVLAPTREGGVTKVITKIDTITKNITTTKYKKGDAIPFVVLDTIYQVNEVHDTTYIVNDYNKVKVYTDTLRINTDNYVSIQDTISQNKIFGRGYDAHFTEKTIVKVRELRTPPPPPKAALYWGVMATKQEDNFGYGGGLIYKSPNKGIIQLNITNNKQFQLGYYSKIF
jgi:hypothetical protein